MRRAILRMPDPTSPPTTSSGSSPTTRRRQAIGSYAIAPPIEPMLAKVAGEIPQRGEFLFEPKWDGFRALVFRGDDVFIQSRDLRPLDRYFPELNQALLERLPKGCVLDGEIVV